MGAYGYLVCFALGLTAAVAVGILGASEGVLWVSATLLIAGSAVALLQRDVAAERS
ncbi:MAG: hypothetical protein QF893_11545 [Alphaproteobacteria bacterium]|jgi:hypothetical protein|nr:hypothetical protein [Alphaproteobacteria bacterium]